MTSAFLARQLERWTRPNAYLFVRPDWRRFTPTHDDHPFELYEQKYSPNQPRVPAGSREGGQWTAGGGGSGRDDEGEYGDRLPPNARLTQYEEEF